MFAVDISCVNGMSSWITCDEGMQSFEYPVDCFVAAASVLPTFHNSLVVSVCDKVVALSPVVKQNSNEAFKSNSFSPSNVSVSFKCFPSGYEAPCSPVFADDDGNADF